MKNNTNNPIEIYKNVLNGSLKYFPVKYWKVDNEKSFENSRKIVKYLLEDELKMNIEDNLQEIYDFLKSRENLKKYKLQGMSITLFNRSTYELLNNTYPEKNFKPWEINIPKNYWNEKENIKKAIKWLIEEKLKIKPEDILNLNITNILKENKLFRLTFVNLSYFEIFDIAYPGKFKPWEFIISREYWNDENNIKEAIKWLISKLIKENLPNENITEEQYISKYILNNSIGNLFKENKLYGLCNNTKYTYFEIFDIAYPGKFKPWEFIRVSKYYWKNENNVKDAVKWLIEEKLKMTDKQLLECDFYNILKDNGLSAIKVSGDYSKYKLLNLIYPGKFELKQFKNHHRFKI